MCFDNLSSYFLVCAINPSTCQYTKSSSFVLDSIKMLNFDLYDFFFLRWWIVFWNGGRFFIIGCFDNKESIANGAVWSKTFKWYVNTKYFKLYLINLFSLCKCKWDWYIFTLKIRFQSQTSYIPLIMKTTCIFSFVNQQLNILIVAR